MEGKDSELPGVGRGEPLRSSLSTREALFRKHNLWWNGRKRYLVSVRRSSQELRQIFKAFFYARLGLGYIYAAKSDHLRP